jgi:hypothetical protein
VTYIDLTKALCEQCGKPFRWVDSFVPWGDGVVHVRCWEPEDEQ